MPKMLKKYKKNSKRWNFVEILYFKYLNFLIKIWDPYNKTAQKCYNFLKTIDM